MARLIDSISLPDGLRGLDSTQLQVVADELRDELISVMSESSGHFASSLGTVELTVALHSVFQTPADRLVWDVGHQAYIHKMVTGRRSALAKIRQNGGISGFLKRSESPYDSFGAGHAGTSISAAVGMSIALQKEDPERYVVPIIGDGSITAGMAFEALNHAGHLGLKNFIVVVNDNEMSISPNVGALSWLFSKAVTSHTSTVARDRFKNLYRQGYVPDLVYKVIDKVEELTQGFFAGPALLFESFGFRYIGPVDGHNLSDLLIAFENAKAQDVPVVVHTYTTKGKGYLPAEGDPIKWHAVTPFDRKAGKFIQQTPTKPTPVTYTKAFADSLLELASRDKKIVGITAAMLSGTGLETLQANLPEQCFDVGICEQHAVTMAAGLACEGYKPVVAIYSTFLQRAYDQVVHDVAIQNLPVVFVLDRGGVVGNDGETHQGVFDISYLRSTPNMIVMSPKDEAELRHMLYSAIEYNAPVAIRFPRGSGLGVEKEIGFKKLPIGEGEIVAEGKDILIIAFGPLLSNAAAAAVKLKEELGLTTTIINARFVKPLDEKLICSQVARHQLTCTVEDHALQGGFGSAVVELLSDNKVVTERPLIRFGIADRFVPHASQSEQYAMNGCDPESIFRTIQQELALKRVIRQSR